MKQLKLFVFPILFILSSCYLYKPYKFKVDDGMSSPASKAGAVSFRDEVGKSNKPANPMANREDASNTSIGALGSNTSDETKSSPSATESVGGKTEKPQGFSKNLDPEMSQKNKGNNTVPGSASADHNVDSIKIKIQPNKYYKITAEAKQYKIQADKWEGDTLVSHILRKPQKVLRFHKDQIEEESLLERRFSKPFSDLFTVGAYVAGGAAILLLVL